MLDLCLKHSPPVSSSADYYCCLRLGGIFPSPKLQAEAYLTPPMFELNRYVPARHHLPSLGYFAIKQRPDYWITG